jgi:signal transduction histidine kinase
MRERVSLAGGELETGWRDGMFTVRAVLPMKAAE